MQLSLYWRARLVQTLATCTVPQTGYGGRRPKGGAVLPRRKPMSAFGEPATALSVMGCVPIPGVPTWAWSVSTRCCFAILAGYFEHGLRRRRERDAAGQITDMLAKLHVQYVRNADRIHDDVGAVKNLERPRLR